MRWSANWGHYKTSLSRIVLLERTPILPSLMKSGLENTFGATLDAFYKKARWNTKM